jgi:hypothetical protein
MLQYAYYAAIEELDRITKVMQQIEEILNGEFSESIKK